MDKQATDTRKCPQCQSDISILAKKCPFCQSKVKPVRKPMSKGMKILIGVGVVSWIMMLVLASSSSTPYEPQHESPESWAWVYPQMVVKQTLKAPSTADFCSPTVTALENSKYKIESCVDSQNGFGAMIRSSWGAMVTYSGSNPENSASWTIDRITFDGKVIYDGK